MTIVRLKNNKAMGADGLPEELNGGEDRYVCAA